MIANCTTYQTAYPTKKPAMRTIERIPLELASRRDLKLERSVMKWNGNPFRLEGSDSGIREDDGGFSILPFWLGRHHRFIGEPASR